MEALIKVQYDLFESIKRAQTNWKKTPKDRFSIEYVETRQEAVEESWAQFRLTHTQIVQESDRVALASSSYAKEGVYDEAEELYIAYKTELKKMLTKFKAVSSSSQKVPAEAKGSEQIRLPKITIPPFSGTYTQWISFRDLFLSLVHNNSSLDNVQKLHYLKSHLTGEADQLLRHIPITADNYKTCWELLTKRFNNKKYLSSCILKRFLSQRNINVESASALKELLDTTNDCLYSLRNIGVDIQNWDILVIHILCLKLDSETRKQWEFKVSEASGDFSTYKQFQEFLETRFRALENIDPKPSRPISVQKSTHQNVSHTTPKVHHVSAPSAPSCTYCSESHKIMFCKAFSRMDIDSRRNFVQTNNLCFNCLNPGHAVFTCRQTTRCRICNKKHHSLLHPKNQTDSTDSNVGPNHSVDRKVVAHATTNTQTSADETTNFTACFSTSHSQVLLATALVKAQSKAGTGITIRCLLDQGSQASFITEPAVQLLGLKKIPHTSAISVLGGDENANVASKSRVQVNIQSLHDPNFVVGVNAFVLSKLTSILPDKRVVVELHSEFADLNLADPSFDIPNKIDMLLGADVYGQVLLDGMIKGRSGTPTAQKTALGWIISGPVNMNGSLSRNVSVNHVHVNDNDMLKRFWELENDTMVTDPKELYTEEEKRCQEIYAATTTRDSSGRYIVKLPFREPNPECTNGNSEAIAAKRFSFLERKLEMNELLSRGGFELQKWSSNQEELMEMVTEEKREVEGHVELKIDTVMKILGLTWNRSCDEFEYAVQLPELRFPVTKRKIISDISRLFDPLGWLAPVIVSAKIFIQKLWLSGIEWDDEVPPQLLKEWLSYRETLSQLVKFKLPRWIHTSNSDETLELQGFCDASDDAYAAVVYIRVVDCRGNVHVSLITSKTKVAPIKKVSIPRLELCGAVLLTKLLAEVSKVLNVDKMDVHAWTDSSIVLSWLNSRPNRWKTFVANRVTEIITSLEPSQWAHVSSKDNPADCASRGIHQFTDEQLWKEGPSWLKQKNINYTKIVTKDTHLEGKSNEVCLLNTCEIDADVEDEVMSKFSSLRRLIRVVAYCKRFIKRCRIQITTKWLTTQEILDSISTCIKITQQKYFKEELCNLKENKLVNKKSKLTSLNPVVDDLGILKVGGRLQQAGISEMIKHPIILPQRSHFTDLVVAKAHEKTLHGGPQLMLNYLRSKYWVVGAKNLVKFFVRRCIKCLRDLTHLTPGHFLVGEPLILIPEGDYLHCNISSLKRWQLTQKMVQEFWHRWSREYLTQFYHRYKWSHQTPEPSVGNVVLVKEDDLPPAKWLYGLIIEKHPGLDGVTRVVSLKCKGNVIKRPVSKLCCLPID